jgi:3-hydroxybutyryl-CoA dehydrogenase
MLAPLEEEPMSEVKRISVIGAGTMGHGIAQVASSAGYEVVLNDVSEEQVGKGIDAIRASLEKGIAKGKISPDRRDATLAGIRASTDLREAVARADLVVEAVPESLDLKRRILGAADEAAPAAAVLATNTSSLSVARIAEATGRPGQVVGMHFFNPVQLMPLLEVVRSEATAGDAVRTACEVGTRLGKETIVVRDSPGFATSRLGLVLGLEAIRMLEQEVASAEDIDKAMTLGYRHPMGPLRLTDLVGLDVRLAIARYLHDELGSEAFRPPELLERMVADGKLGKKTGIGFYRWD